MSSNDEAKRVAATEAVNTYIRSGMRVGLGTGSTASFAVKRLAERIQQGEVTDIVCASTSEATSRLAESLGIKVVPLDSIPLPLDVAIDGADEVLVTGQRLVLIKGRGGALLREKIVETNAKCFVCVAGEDKIVSPSSFGTTGALPLEVVQFACEATRRKVLSVVISVLKGGPPGAPTPPQGPPEGASGGAPAGAPDVENEAAALGVSAVYRQLKGGNGRFVTDNGNFCLDIFVKKCLEKFEVLEERLLKVPGVVDTGLFIGICSICVLGSSSGKAKTLTV